MSGNKKPSRTKQPGAQSIPWDLVLADYLADHTLTYTLLAKKYKVSKSSIGKKAKKDEWVKLRQNSTEELVADVLENKTKQIADANKRHLDGAILIQEATLSGIKAIKDNEIEEIIWFREDGDDSEDTRKKGEMKEAGRRYINGPVYNSKTLAELIRGYRMAADLERAVLGLATNVQGFGDEDGNKPAIIYDIMGGAKNANSNSSAGSKTAGPTASKS